MSEETFTGTEMPDSMVEEMFTASTTEAPTEPAVEAAAVEPADPGTPEEVVADVPAEPATEPAATGEELPEGATLRAHKGVEEIHFQKERGLAIYAGYKLAQEAENVLGEPLSVEALNARQQSHEWFQNQHFDTISDNPESQSEVFRNIFRDAAQAISAGEIGHDPLETMPDAFLSTLRQVAPEHYDRAATGIVNERIQALYREAAQTGNDKLMRTAQNLDHFINKKFIDDADVKKMAAPVDDREARLTARERAIADHDRKMQNVAFKTWHGDLVTSIQTGVKSVLASQIPETVRKAFEALPEGVKRLESTITLLDIEVRNSIKSDQKWQDQNKDLIKLAQMAPTEERRKSIQQQITQRYEQKARQVMAAKAKSILDAQSMSIKDASAATHKKMAEGAQQKGSTGSGKPAVRSIPDAIPPGQSWEDFIDSRP